MADYYATLGVDRSASADELKRAYRRLARESHPDANPGDPHAEERFKQINEAYAVLSDPAKRQQYDTFGDVRGAGPGFGDFGGFGDLGDIMETFFGGAFGGGRARTQRRTTAREGGDMGTRLNLTFREAVFGCSKEVEVTARRLCDRCEGAGTEQGTYWSRCDRCGGSGQMRQTRQSVFGTVLTTRPCVACGGAGEMPSVPCEACGGDGRVVGTSTLTVEVPAGVQDGMTLRLRGRGEAGARGGADGDLFVELAVEPDEVFERAGDDVHCALAVPLTQAILGAELDVATLDGEERVRIEPGTQPGHEIRLRGLGVPRLQGRGRGDLILHVDVEIPASLPGDQRELVERLAELRGEPTAGGGRGILGRIRDSLRGQ